MEYTDDEESSRIAAGAEKQVVLVKNTKQYKEKKNNEGTKNKKGSKDTKKGKKKSAAKEKKKKKAKNPYPLPKSKRGTQMQFGDPMEFDGKDTKKKKKSSNKAKPQSDPARMKMPMKRAHTPIGSVSNPEKVGIAKSKPSTKRSERKNDELIMTPDGPKPTKNLDTTGIKPSTATKPAESPGKYMSPSPVDPYCPSKYNKVTKDAPVPKDDLLMAKDKKEKQEKPEKPKPLSNEKEDALVLVKKNKIPSDKKAKAAKPSGEKVEAPKKPDLKKSDPKELKPPAPKVESDNNKEKEKEKEREKEKEKEIMKAKEKEKVPSSKVIITSKEEDKKSSTWSQPKAVSSKTSKDGVGLSREKATRELMSSETVPVTPTVEKAMGNKELKPGSIQEAPKARTSPKGTSVQVPTKEAKKTQKLPEARAPPPSNPAQLSSNPENSNVDVRLRVNIDEVLRLGSVLERFHLTPEKREAFEWIAKNRHQVYDQPKVFAFYLNYALSDIIMDKLLAQDALNVLLYQTTLTPDEYLKLYQIVDDAQAPLTIGMLAFLLKENSAYYAMKSRQ